MSETMRLFIGVKVSLDTVAAVTDAVTGLRAAAERAGVAVRWAAPATYHVTLKFLGATRREAVAAIDDAVSAAIAGEAAFEFTARGAGAFPSPSRARVVWIGADDPTGGLTRLAQAVDRAVAPLGFERERRPFHPHITIGRLKRPADVEQILASGAEQSYSGTRTGSVVLFESITKSSGSEYVERARWPLRDGDRQTESLQPPSNPNEAGD